MPKTTSNAAHFYKKNKDSSTLGGSASNPDIKNVGANGNAQKSRNNSNS